MADWVNGANDNENDQNQQQTSASKTAAIISKPPSVSITTEAPQTETTSQPLTTSSGPKGSVSQPHKVRLTQYPPVLSQAMDSVNPATMQRRNRIPKTHVIPNLSARIFPTSSSFPTKYAKVSQPVRGPVALTSATAAPIVTQLRLLRQLSYFKVE